MGDCAARGADLFESIAAEIISAMILGGTMAKRCKLDGQFINCVCLRLSHYIFSALLGLEVLICKDPCTTDILLTDCIADPSGFILFPLVVHSFDLVVSAIGIASIKGTRDVSSKSLVEDPMVILQKGYSVTLFLAVLAFGGVSISRILDFCILMKCFLVFVLIVL